MCVRLYVCIRHTACIWVEWNIIFFCIVLYMVQWYRRLLNNRWPVYTFWCRCLDSTSFRRFVSTARASIDECFFFLNLGKWFSFHTRTQNVNMNAFLCEYDIHSAGCAVCIIYFFDCVRCISPRTKVVQLVQHKKLTKWLFFFFCLQHN